MDGIAKGDEDFHGWKLFFSVSPVMLMTFGNTILSFHFKIQIWEVIKFLRTILYTRPLRLHLSTHPCIGCRNGPPGGSLSASTVNGYTERISGRDKHYNIIQISFKI